MKIAIHHNLGSFSDRWIAYCDKHGINYKMVNCYATDIIKQLEDCDALMWHHQQSNYKDVLFSKQLHFAVEQSGRKVFPNYKTFWHFDDKVGQKYLFEAIGAPLVPSYVFYSKGEALQWANNTTFPKVFKLSGGAGSTNVRLIQSALLARKIIGKAFGNGFSQFHALGSLKERIRRYREGKDTFLGILKGLARLLFSPEFARMHANEKGYVYFQDYIPNNDCDIRVVVIDEKAFAIKRMVRKNDFRASGSGDILYERKNFPIDTIKLSFRLAEKLESQCAAFDFVYDSTGNPMVVEVSYGFVAPGYDPCVGYWDKSLHFYEGTFDPQGWMVEMLLNTLQRDRLK
jgi:glutathione synthase/RimK-type ligase-like ATP-grasp enzyme